MSYLPALGIFEIQAGIQYLLLGTVL